MQTKVRILFFELLYRILRRIFLIFNKKLSRQKFRRKVANLLAFVITSPEVKIYGRRFQYKLSTTLGLKLFFDGSFEGIQIKYCEKFIKEDSVIVDVGANIGVYSFHYAPIATQGILVAIEPGRKAFQMLVNNLRYFSNVIPLNVAVSDVESVVDFYETNDTAYSGLRITGRDQVVSVRKIFSYKVDTLIGAFNLPKVDFLKVDVEGFELSVLKGCNNLLVKYRPVILCEICSRNSGIDSSIVIQYVLSLNYRVFVFQGKEFVPYHIHADTYQDYLFIPFEKCIENCA
ncbi:MAG: FkbM family methyltransferase [Flavobacteriales bacterium]|nr:FkbM family methyltransferase [Flavobacteriales bacterium]